MKAMPRFWAWACLALLAVSAALSNTVLFRQVVQGHTDYTRNIPARLGEWEMLQERPASASEIQGLETRDIIKRTYGNGRTSVELVIAYIAHSSRKSAHAQEACLRGAGALVGSITDVYWDEEKVGSKLISLDMGNRRQWVSYWYKIGNTYTADYLGSSLRMFLGGLVGSRHQGASLIRLSTPENPGETPAQIQARLRGFTRVLLPELEKNLL